MALLMIGILSFVSLPFVNAETFNIGIKVGESDPDVAGYQWYYFDSGCMIKTKSNFIDHIKLIFDGNLSTGINHNFGPGNDTMLLLVVFPNYYINNITFKPVFEGNASKYKTDSSNLLIYIGNEENWFTLPQYVEKTIQINGNIDSMRIWLDSNGTNHFYFNDVIINYTSTPTNLTEVIQAIEVLETTVNSLQNQIDNLTWQIDILNNTIIEMNNTINELNQTQNQILEDITNIWSTYNLLNSSIMNLIKEIEDLNITTNENITLLKNDLTLIGTDINNLYRSMENLTTNVTELSEIQVQINEITQDINNLNENITVIKSTMPSEYDDTILTNRVFQLESENTVLNAEIENLTTEIENLNEEIEKLKDDKDEPDNYVTFGALILGIVGILIATIAIILVSKKSGSQTPPIDKEEPEESIQPEKDENKVNEEKT